MDQSERSERVSENNDIAIIDDSRFFLRAVVPVPVLGRVQPYNIGIWVEVSEPTFAEIYKLWDDPAQQNSAPFSAVASNDIPSLPALSGLLGSLLLTGPTTRPKLMLPDSAHPLAVEQATGIAPHRAHYYSSIFAARDA